MKKAFSLSCVALSFAALGLGQTKTTVSQQQPTGAATVSKSPAPAPAPTAASAVAQRALVDQYCGALGLRVGRAWTKANEQAEFKSEPSQPDYRWPLYPPFSRPADP